MEVGRLAKPRQAIVRLYITKVRNEKKGMDMKESHFLGIQSLDYLDLASILDSIPPGTVSRSCHYLCGYPATEHCWKSTNISSWYPLMRTIPKSSVVPEAVYMLHLTSFSCLLVAVAVIVVCLFVFLTTLLSHPATQTYLKSPRWLFSSLSLQ